MASSSSSSFFLYLYSEILYKHLLVLLLYKYLVALLVGQHVWRFHNVRGPDLLHLFLLGRSWIEI